MRICNFLFLTLPCCFLFQMPVQSAEDTREQKLTIEAQQLINDYAGQLKTALVHAMKTGGPITAIDVCAQKSPEIAQEISEKSGWTIGRTSLKIRNESSAADQWEAAILQSFEKRLQAGDDIKTIEHTEITEDGAKFRYMKAIPTQALCLTCHGKNIQPDIKQQLEYYYPGDHATGYDLGMIRGAFTVERNLTPSK